eukprot:Clim_evm76s144 gene=Clim_evmTU76s144
MAERPERPAPAPPGPMAPIRPPPLASPTLPGDKRKESLRSTADSAATYPQRSSLNSLFDAQGVFNHRRVESDMSLDENGNRKIPMLCDAVLLIGLPSNVSQDNPLPRQPQILKMFTRPNSSDEELEVLRNLAIFCYPDAEIWTDPINLYPSEEFSFVLTDFRGNKRFGYCRRFLPRGEGPSIPITYCIVSRGSALSLYSTILQRLELRRAVSSEHSNALAARLLELPFPGRGQKMIVDMNVGSSLKRSTREDNEYDQKQVYMFERNRELGAYEHVDLHDLFTSLSPNQLVDLLLAVLLEKRVCLLSVSISALSSSVHAIVALLYPLRWQHTYVAVLPTPMKDYLSSPAPFIIGYLGSQNILGSVFETMLEHIEDGSGRTLEQRCLDDPPDDHDVLVVDLDKGRMWTPYTFYSRVQRQRDSAAVLSEWKSTSALPADVEAQRLSQASKASAGTTGTDTLSTGWSTRASISTGNIPRAVGESKAAYGSDLSSTSSYLPPSNLIEFPKTPRSLLERNFFAPTIHLSTSPSASGSLRDSLGVLSRKSMASTAGSASSNSMNLEIFDSICPGIVRLLCGIDTAFVRDSTSGFYHWDRNIFLRRYSGSGIEPGAYQFMSKFTQTQAFDEMILEREHLMNTRSESAGGNGGQEALDRLMDRYKFSAEDDIMLMAEKTSSAARLTSRVRNMLSKASIRPRSREDSDVASIDSNSSGKGQQNGNAPSSPRLLIKSKLGTAGFFGSFGRRKNTGGTVPSVQTDPMQTHDSDDSLGAAVQTRISAPERPPPPEAPSVAVILDDPAVPLEQSSNHRLSVRPPNPPPMAPKIE